MEGKAKGKQREAAWQGGRGRSQGGERPMGTTACGGKGSKGRAAKGDRPVGAASCRREQYTRAASPPPPATMHPMAHKDVPLCIHQVVQNIWQAEQLLYRNIQLDPFEDLPEPEVESPSGTRRQTMFTEDKEEDKDKDGAEDRPEPEYDDDGAMQVLWRYACPVAKGQNVTCFAWNKVNTDILAVGYGESSMRPSPRLRRRAVHLAPHSLDPSWPTLFPPPEGLLRRRALPVQLAESYQDPRLSLLSRAPLTV